MDLEVTVGGTIDRTPPAAVTPSRRHGDTLAVFLFSAGIYGFALLAMLVPAVSDFDISLGRTSAIQG
jgi:hypothetical protein